MSKTILITGSTDGIGLETAKLLAADGHTVLMHGRSSEKLDAAAQTVAKHTDGAAVETFKADLSLLADVDALAKVVAARGAPLDVLINNAGVYKTRDPITADDLDARFVVNTIAPYRLTRLLLPQIPASGRVVNLSSAAQAPVQIEALRGQIRVEDMQAYAQSKLAITMWTTALAEELRSGPVVVSVNPGSLLASKMVKEGFGVAGNDLSIGAEILVRAALSDEFATASGKYFDNDSGRFAPPHRDGLDPVKINKVVAAVEDVITSLSTGT
ncbi:MAG: SDR family NAD(P)-dependent oxidoreductase [Pseudomonadota bacterium]